MTTTASQDQQPPPPPPPPPPLHLTIRFSASLPDLDLDIPSPQTTTVLSLKHILRTRLSTRNRLRLIYQGRLLPDPSALSAVLKPLPSPLPPPPPPARDDPKDKGKAVVGAPPPVARVYVNCSIGDELTAEELAAEALAAQKPPETTAASASAGGTLATPSTRPRPRGFDRLLQSGFTPSEIATLRTQFNSIHTARFTPDAMPSPDTLRSMEDAWIDNNADGIPSEGNNPLEDEYAGMASTLEIVFRAMVIGFFFPLGSMAWLLREEGIWSKRWQVFVAFGVAFSLTIGIVMSVSGDRD